jgi:uncharacterized protein
VCSKNVLILFIKNPEYGKVKTRLAETAGERKAYQTYKKLLRHTLHVTAGVNVQREIWYSSFIDKKDGIDENLFKKHLQQGSNLGERMKQAFQKVFSEGCEKAVIIGSDCPGISSGILKDAFSKLDNHDLVIGPAEDGGYYLLGMKTFYPSVFDRITWSTNTVFNDTMKRIDSLNLDCHRLRVLNDIDTEADLKRSGFDV